MVDGLRVGLPRALLRLLVPPRCGFCHAESASELACPGCLAALPWNRPACPVCALPQAQGAVSACARCAARPPSYDRAWSAFRLELPIAQAIHGLKYHAQLRQARWFGLAMAEVLARRAEPLPELLLPVPLHAGRLRRRGYNQALELARGLARRLCIEIAAEGAERIRATPDQIGQDAAARGARRVRGLGRRRRAPPRDHRRRHDDRQHGRGTRGDLPARRRDAHRGLDRGPRALSRALRLQPRRVTTQPIKRPGRRAPSRP